MAQTITVNGTPMLVSDDISFPFWLESGSSISPEVPVSSISVLEFNIVPNNNGNDMVFNQVISVTEGQTVPEGKTWKVESVLMENQSFSVSSLNPNTFVPYSQSGDNFIMQNPIFYLENIHFRANLLPNPNNSINELGFCYSYDNSQPSIYDSYIEFDGDMTNDFFSVNVNFDSLQMKYVRAYSINNEGITYSSVKEINRPDIYIGREMEGGVVFYLDQSGEHGLIAAMNELGYDNDPYFEWGCSGENITGANSYEIGSGHQNTIDIINFPCATLAGNVGGTAAGGAYNYSHDGYSDWYLPSLYEAREIYFNVGPASPFGSLISCGNTIWTSSVSLDYDGQSMGKYWNHNGENQYIRHNLFSVIPIRSF